VARRTLEWPRASPLSFGMQVRVDDFGALSDAFPGREPALLRPDFCSDRIACTAAAGAYTAEPTPGDPGVARVSVISHLRFAIVSTWLKPVEPMSLPVLAAGALVLEQLRAVRDALAERSSVLPVDVLLALVLARRARVLD